MRNFKEYSDVSAQIHAPEALKHKVLQEARQIRMEQKNKGQCGRGWSFVHKAAVAAVLAAALPVTAFAVAKGMGLMDHLREQGMQNVEIVQELANSGAELSGDEQANSYKNKYAEYTIFEAVCDSQSIYLAAKVEPLDDRTLLLPQYIMPEDNAANLGIEGVSEGTVKDYAESLGKQIAYAGVGYSIGESHLDGSEDFAFGEDGALYYYYSAQNISGEKNITLKCTGTGYDESMEFTSIDRVEFVVRLTDKSSTTDGMVYASMDPKAYEETGIQINSLTFEETEMGLYATFNFSVADARFVDVGFKLVDGAGKELVWLPGLGSGTIENGDGTFRRTLYYQMPDSVEGMQFLICDFGNAVNYGPYSFAQ